MNVLLVGGVESRGVGGVESRGVGIAFAPFEMRGAPFF